jgi:hypothetical protein
VNLREKVLMWRMKGIGICKKNDLSKHGLLSLKTCCEVRKWDLVKFIVVET